MIYFALGFLTCYLLTGLSLLCGSIVLDGWRNIWDRGMKQPGLLIGSALIWIFAWPYGIVRNVR